MTEMAAKGFTANQTIAAMPGVIAAAEASGEDLALAADTVASALNIFGLEAGESSRVADILTMTANQSAAGITDMQYALKYAGAPAAALGISLEELSASIGLVVDSGIDGSSAGTALRASLLALNNPAKAQAKIMDELGFSLTDSEGKTKSMADMIRDMTTATQDMSEAEKVATLAKLVGTEAVSGFLALMKAGPEEIEKNTKALEDSEGVAAKTAAAMKDGIGGALENLSGAFETLSILIGDQLIPYVEKAAGFLASLAEKFIGLSDGTQKFLAVGTAIVGIFSAIAAGIGIAMVVVGSIITSLGTLATALGIAGGAGGLLSAVFAAITGPIGIAVAAIAGIIAAVVLAYNKIDWFRDMVNAAWAKIKDLTVIAFNAIKKAITDAIAAVLAFVKPQLDKFKAFWAENGTAIKSIVKTSFESISIIIKGVMNAIKGVFQAVWPVISATVKAAWETIKLAVSTAINIILGVIQTVLKLIQGDWKGAWETIKSTLVKIWADIGKYLKGIDLAETGKDIIRGLIKGIASMGSAIKETVSNLASKIPEWAKKILGIHSPSRVMAELGVFTGQGLANGVASTQKMVKDATAGVTNVIKSIITGANSELTAIHKKQAAEEKVVEQNKARDIANIHAIAKSNKRNLTVSETQRIAKIEQTAASNLTKIERKYAEDSAKVQSDLAKEKYTAVKTYVDDKKSLEQLSLVAETEVWRKSIDMFKVGTKERVDAQQAYQQSLKAVNDVIVKTNEEYAGKMTTINENLRKEEESLTSMYTKSVDDRAKALVSFAGTFDLFEVKLEKSGADLLTNLESQVAGFKLWQQEIEKLSAKAIDRGLIEELRAMGPKALPELMALNSLTDTQLSEYSALYKEKAALARKQAETELVGMKNDTAKRIKELRATANTELEALRVDWVKKIQAVTKATDGELMSLKSIGVNAGQGLLAGLASTEDSLVAKARSIANAVSAAMASALKIKSPSRVTMRIGEFVGEGLEVGIDNSVAAVMQAARSLANAAVPEVPKIASYQTPSVSAGRTSLSASTSGVNASAGGITQHIAIHSPTALSASDIARKNKQASQQLALEWGMR